MITGSRFCFKEGDLEVVCEDDDNGGVVAVPGCAANNGVSNELWGNRVEDVIKYINNTNVGGCVAACAVDQNCTGWSVDFNPAVPECFLFNPSENPVKINGWCRGLKQGSG